MPAKTSRSKPAAPRGAGRPAAAGALPDLREAILREAKALFRTQGYAAVSTNAVCTAVGISKSTLYHYFADKETLYAQVMVAMLKHGNALFTAGVGDAPTLREQLYRAGTGYFRFSPVSVAATLRDAQAQLGEAAYREVQAAYEAYVLLPFERLFAEAAARGEVRPGRDAALLAQVFLSMLDAALTRFTGQHGRKFAFADIARECVDIFMDGVGRSR
ncbi:MAG: TetR/AcrR family transcriptional regulator [Candidatus Melainabacteria bacterium]